MSVALKGLVIVLALIAFMAFILYAVSTTETGDDEPLTPDELAELRSRWACYEDGEIDDR